MVFHLGDHDPSGVDMTRDNEERLAMFSDHRIRIERLALNMDQVKKYDPPPNPAKMSDTRCEWYIRQFGTESWELDALDPEVLVDLVRNAVKPIIDQEKWEQAVSREERDRAILKKVVKHWDLVEDVMTES